MQCQETHFRDGGHEFASYGPLRAGCGSPRSAASIFCQGTVTHIRNRCCCLLGSVLAHSKGDSAQESHDEGVSRRRQRSSESSGLSLGLEKGEDVSLSDGTLNVSHEVTGALVEEHDLDLGDTTTGSYLKQDKSGELMGMLASKLTSLSNDLHNLSKNYFTAIHYVRLLVCYCSKISSEE